MTSPIDDKFHGDYLMFFLCEGLDARSIFSADDDLDKTGARVDNRLRCGSDFVKSSAVREPVLWPKTLREVELGEDLGEDCGDAALKVPRDVGTGEGFGEVLREVLGADRGGDLLLKDETAQDPDEDADVESSLLALSIVSTDSKSDENETVERRDRVEKELFNADVEFSLLFLLSCDVVVGLRLSDHDETPMLSESLSHGFPSEAIASRAS